MYQLGLNRNFSARHYLIGGDWGAENHEHAHQYRLECILKSNILDQHGYLIDIVELNRALDQILLDYADKTLNSCSAFKDLNPSLENFARILNHALRGQLCTDSLTSIEIILWEDEEAWASYTHLVQ
ncbi:MAG TPA: 6-pyruvoyl tetrahydropterin synthase [Gammaproteobacteria bacterium]|nr:6-pyruvoyl tetrahydropterin synthase [Gammaproteobacteria bacterium]